MCLSDLDVLSIVEGSVGDDARERMLRHADDCPSCRSMLVAIGRNIDTPAYVGGVGTEVVRGATVGRYVVLELIGIGGMGEVHRAFDPVLERNVALKLLREETGARDRIVREGIALAKLSHPNVVAVFDVGAIDERLYVAMEYIEGRTLRAWLAEEPRSWREIVTAFVAAGRGLAAAHAEQIVHRDFKPENVLVGRDDRVRVVDFGLARPVDGGDDDALVGTPPYMAPELFVGERTPSPAQDQYAFCIALYESLYGLRPYEGDTTAAIVARAKRGELPPPPAGSRVPAWLHRIVARGLAAAPADRFPSMTELLRELDRDPQRRTRGIAAIATGVAVLAVGTAAFALATRGGAAPLACENGDAQFRDAWDIERRAAVDRAFTATNKPYAAATGAAVAHALDGYAQRWSDAYREACVATRVRGEQSEQLLDLRMACLYERRRAAGALVELFTHADADIVQRAARAADQLPGLEACADTVGLRAALAEPTDPAARAQLDAIRDTLAEAYALRFSGKYARALESAKKAVAAARTLSFAPALAEALYLTGVLESDTGDPRKGVTTLDAAAAAAAEAHHDRVATQTLLDLAQIHGDKLQHLDTASAFIQSADWAVVRTGSDPAFAARVVEIRALILEGQGKHAEATPYFERTLALADQLHGKNSVWSARKLLALGENKRLLHAYAAARELDERARAIFEAELGPEHPDVAVALNDLAVAFIDDGKFSEARPIMERALAIRRTSLGPNHPDVARTLSNLANIAIAVKHWDEAATYAKDALAGKEASLGPTHPSLAFTLIFLSDAELGQLRLDDALAHAERARAIREKALPADHPLLLEAIVWIGYVHLARHEPQLALAPLEHAHVALAKLDEDPATRGGARYLLGRALWEIGDRTRAVPLLREARTDLVKSGDRGAEQRNQFTEWLAKVGVTL